MKRAALVGVLSCCLAGCSTYASFNEKEIDPPPPNGRGTFDIRNERGQKDVLVLLALSGGGSRAAYFSGAVMLRLQQVFPDVDLLQEVDAISSVSGGSLPAAYYAISRDCAVRLQSEFPKEICSREKLSCNVERHELSLKARLNPDESATIQKYFTNPYDRRQFQRLVAQQDVVSERCWDEPTVKDLMSRNYIARWIGNWFWPNNIARFWFTSYDRSDIMAQTFADNLYDVQSTGRDLEFRDINPERPYLILNATNGTEKAGPADPEFGSEFTFTDEDFRVKARSDINSYEIARAVMNSAAFPVVFNYMTLRNYNYTDEKRYLHLFDGGNADNLGLTSLKRIVLDDRNNTPSGRYRKIIVILVDSHVRPKGVDRDKADPRCVFCYVVDTNVVDAVDSLLELNRDGVLQDFTSMNTVKDCQRGNLPRALCDSTGLGERKKEIEDKLFFYHVRFEDSSKRDLLEKIPTDFKLTADKNGQPNTGHLDAAANELISQDNTCLQRIRRIIKAEETPQDQRQSNSYCTWQRPLRAAESEASASSPR